jgi:hypothetical protein
VSGETTMSSKGIALIGSSSACAWRLPLPVSGASRFKSDGKKANASGFTRQPALV